MGLRTWGYILREAFLSIPRNGLMSLASASTVAVCLLVFATFVFLGLNLEYVARTLESQVEVAAYLKDGSRGQVEVLRAEILKLHGVTGVQFVTKEEALERLKKQWGEDSSNVFEGLEDMNPLPDSLEIRVKPELADEVADEVRLLPGVEKVRAPKEIIERLAAVIQGIRIAGAGLTLLLATVTVFIISNTIRLTVYARRNEIKIIRLVGGTDSFIRWPFIIEGMSLGLAGSIVAVVMVRLMYPLIVSRISEYLPFLPILPARPHVDFVSVGLLMFGICLGAVGSTVSVRRFLKG